MFTKYNAQLLEAAKKGDFNSLRDALQKGATPNVIDEHCSIGGHQTCYALHYAVWSNSFLSVEALINAGAGINVLTGGNSDTPLHWAAGYAADNRILQLLLEKGAKYVVNLNNQYPHESAVVHGKPERVRIILNIMNNLDQKLRIETNNQLDKINELQLYNCGLTSESMKCLEPILKNSPKLEVVNLGGNPIDIVDIGILSNAKFLRVLHIQSITLNFGSQKLIEIIKNNPGLVHLNLNHVRLGDEGARLLADSLSGRKIIELQLYSSGITSVGMQHLKTVIENNPVLEALNLGNNQFDIGILLQTKSLRVLHIESVQLDQNALQTLKQIIQNNTGLVHFNFNSVQLGDEGAKLLAESLRGRNVIELHLSNCGITSDGMRHLESIFNPELAVLNLGANRIDIIDIDRLSKTRSLSFLHMESINVFTANSDLQKLREIINNNQGLVHLNLNHLQLGDAGAKLIKECFQQRKLGELHIGGNGITSAGMEHLKSIVEDHPELYVLNFEGNQFASELILQNVKLNGLYVESAPLNTEELHKLKKIMVKNLNSIAINLNGVKLGNEGAKMLADILLLRKIKQLKQNQREQQNTTVAIIFPDTAELCFQRGVECNKNGQYLRAIKYFNCGIELDTTNNSEYFHHRAFSKFSLRNFQGSLSDENRAIERRTTDYSYFYRRGCVKYVLGFYEDAINAFTQAITLNTQDILSFNFRGFVRNFAGKYTVAHEDFDNVIKLDATNFIAHLGKAISCVLQKNYEHATELFKKVISFERSQDGCDIRYCKSFAKFGLELVDWLENKKGFPSTTEFFNYVIHQQKNQESRFLAVEFLVKTYLKAAQEHRVEQNKLGQSRREVLDIVLAMLKLYPHNMALMNFQKELLLLANSVVTAVVKLKDKSIDEQGNTELHRLCQQQVIDPKELECILIKGNTDVNAINYHGNTPLYELCLKSKNVNVARILLEKGAKTHLAGKSGKTSIEDIIYDPKHIELSELLLGSHTFWSKEELQQKLNGAGYCFMGDYETKETDKKILDKLVSKLTVSDVNSMMASYRWKYLAHLNSLKGTITQPNTNIIAQDLEGFHQESYLPLRARTLVEIIIFIDKGLISTRKWPKNISKKIMQTALLEQLFALLQTYHVARCAGIIRRNPVLNEEQKERLYKALSKNISKRILQQPFTLAGGYNTHAIYISFSPSKTQDNKITVRIDNLGAGLTENKHKRRYDEQTLNEEALPRAYDVPSTYFNNINTEPTYILNMLKAIAQKENDGFNAIYCIDKKNIGQSWEDSKIEKNFLWRRIQLVGNCVVENYLHSVQLLFNSFDTTGELFQWFQREEVNHLPLYLIQAVKIYNGTYVQNNQNNFESVNDLRKEAEETIQIAKKMYGYHDLHLAVLAERTDEIEKLLKKGVPLTIQTDAGYTPLHLAALYGLKSSAECLLHFAEQQGKEQLQELIQSKTNHGQTVEDLLVTSQQENSHSDCISVLKRFGIKTTPEREWVGVELNYTLRLRNENTQLKEKIRKFEKSSKQPLENRPSQTKIVLTRPVLEISKLKYRLCDVPADGQCLYSAVAMGALIQALQNNNTFMRTCSRLFGQVENTTIEKIRKELKYYNGWRGSFAETCPCIAELVEKKLRQRVVNKIKQTPRIYETLSEKEGHDLHEHLQKGCWGGQHQIEALSLLLDKPLLIYAYNKERQQFVLSQDQIEQEIPSLRLAYVHAVNYQNTEVRNHYQAFVPENLWQLKPQQKGPRLFKGQQTEPNNKNIFSSSNQMTNLRN